MKVLIPIVLFLAVLLVFVVAGMWAGYRVRGQEIDRLKKKLDGIDDPMVWLSDKDRQTYARELLERDRTAYQDKLLKEQHEQLKQFNTPTMEEGNK